MTFCDRCEAVHRAERMVRIGDETLCRTCAALRPEDV